MADGAAARGAPPQSKLDATPPWPVRERPEPPTTTAARTTCATAPTTAWSAIDLGGLLVPRGRRGSNCGSTSARTSRSCR